MPAQLCFAAKIPARLKKWDAVPVAEQEASVGRSKEANEEFSKDVRLPDSHLGRVNLKENGVGLKIVRRSLPFGKISGEHGLMFTSYCNTLHNIEVQLLNSSAMQTAKPTCC